MRQHTPCWSASPRSPAPSSRSLTSSTRSSSSTPAVTTFSPPPLPRRSRCTPRAPLSPACRLSRRRVTQNLARRTLSPAPTHQPVPPQACSEPFAVQRDRPVPSFETGHHSSQPILTRFLCLDYFDAGEPRGRRNPVVLEVAVCLSDQVEFWPVEIDVPDESFVVIERNLQQGGGQPEDMKLATTE